MELKVNKSNTVDFIHILPNGTRVKNQMTMGEAKELINTGKLSKKGNTLTVNDKFIFELEGEVAEEEVKEEVNEEPKEEINSDTPIKEVVKKKPRKKAKKNV